MISDLLSFLAANQHALWQRTVEHLELMFIALFAATAVGIPAGVVAARVPSLSTPFITLANMVQTIPSVALLGFLLPVLGIGRGTASVALFLYALLPIMRNTITGLQGVDSGVKDAARGMGMSGRQVLLGVEFPLALPVIFAGIRTAAVINVGVTTLSALIGAGGLGTFIFRGLATNNTATILLGAIPSAILALLADYLLAFCERLMRRRTAVWAILTVILAVGIVVLGWRHLPATAGSPMMRFGFTSEFMERPDGFEAWRRHYSLPPLESRELDPGLLYSALDLGEVEVACGFSTDGRIEAFALRPLKDDRKFFPSYDAALLVRETTMNKYPGLQPLLEKLGASLDEKLMRSLNRKVDMDKQSPAQVAEEFLSKWASARGIAWDAELARNKAQTMTRQDITIGTKNFTEQYVLGQIVRQLVNGASRLQAGLKQGLGGTAICFQALERGDIDLYPEYSGTLLSSVLKLPPGRVGELARMPGKAEKYLRVQLAAQYGLSWLPPLGFSNTYAILVREKDPQFTTIETISDLQKLRNVRPSVESRQ
jgi:osmoprotectant transport system permease protein